MKAKRTADWKLKLFATTLLVASFFLPQYTCSAPPPPPEADISAQAPGEYTHYAWEGFTSADLNQWLVVAAFFWAIPFLAFTPSRTRRWRSFLAWFCQLLLAFASAYLIWAASWLGRREIGAHLGIAANALFAAALCWEARRVLSAPAAAEQGLAPDRAH